MPRRRAGRRRPPPTWLPRPLDPATLDITTPYASRSEGGGNVAEAQAPAKKGGHGGAAAADPRLQGISDAIRVVPHFPKQGPSAHLCAKTLLLSNHNPPV